MRVPATLQPDGAWKRPAHTDPSQLEAPVGLQFPNCTRPPRWVQKQERGARKDRAPVKLISAGTASLFGGPAQGERRADKAYHLRASSIIAISVAIQSEAIPAKNRRIYINQQQENWLQGGEGEVTVRLEKRNTEGRKTRGDNKHNNLQGKMEFVFQPGSAVSHAWSGLNSYTNRARQHLARGRKRFFCTGVFQNNLIWFNWQAAYNQTVKTQ